MTATSILSQQQTQNLSQTQVQLLRSIALSDDDLRKEIAAEVAKNGALIIKSDTHLSSNSNNTAFNNHEAALENIPDTRITLSEHLTHQINMLKISDEEKTLCLRLIDNLDDNGYHIIDPATLKDKKTSTTLLKKCLSIVQTLDPVGVCVTNLAESLKVQSLTKIANINKSDDNISTLINFLIDNLTMLDPPVTSEVLLKITTYIKKEKSKGDFWGTLKISENLITRENIALAIEIIKSCNPHPASVFKKSNNTAIFDIEVIRKGDNLLVKYYNMLQVVAVDNDYYDKAAISRAKSFVSILEYRAHSIITLARALTDMQRDFFLHGKCNLIPMRQEDLAHHIGIDHSTVSRLCSNRFLRCDWGIFPLKYFFTTNVGGHSATVIKEEINKILNIYGDISDQKITNILASHGYKVARRTVAKYHKGL